MVDMQRLVIPLPPSKNLFGKKAREAFLEERERFLKSLNDLHEQEKQSKVSTVTVIQVLISGWALMRRFPTLRDRELIGKLREVPQIALNYGLQHILRSKYYANLLESIEKLSS